MTEKKKAGWPKGKPRKKKPAMEVVSETVGAPIEEDFLPSEVIQPEAADDWGDLPPPMMDVPPHPDADLHRKAVADVVAAETLRDAVVTPVVKAQHLAKETGTLLDRARAFVIRTMDDVKYVAGMMGVCKERKQDAHKLLDDQCEKTYAAWKGAVALRDKAIKPADEAEKILKDKLRAWNYEQQRIAEAKAREQEQERQRLLEAERARVAFQNPDEPPPDDFELEMQADLPPPAPVAEPPRIEGITFVSKWIAVVDDSMELFRGIVEGTAPKILGMPNLPALHGMAASLKDSFSVPGCHAQEIQNVRNDTKVE